MKIFALILLISNSIQLTIPIHKSNKPNLHRRRNLNHKDSTPIYGNSSELYYYYVNIYFGTPPIKQSLIIDTGSSLIGIPCKSLCRSCGNHINSFYDVNDSNTSKIHTCSSAQSLNIKCDSCEDDKCAYSQSYGEQSTYTGIWVEDLIRFGDQYHENDEVTMPFGCNREETNLFFSQEVNGILGLAPSNGRFKQFVDFMFTKGKISSKTFSLCYGINGGNFSLGESPEDYNTTNHFIKLNFSPVNFYKIKLKTFSLGNFNIIVQDNIMTIIDSGTTQSYFPSNLYSQIIENIKKSFKIKNEYNNIGTLLEIDDNLCILPNYKTNRTIFLDGISDIVLDIENNQILWESKNFLYKKDDYFCIGISKWNSNEILLGGTFMHNFKIIFDLSSNIISIGKANCSDPGQEYDQFKNFESLEFKPDFSNLSSNKTNYLVIILIVLSIISFFAYILIRFSHIIIKNFRKFFQSPGLQRHAYVGSIDIPHILPQVQTI